MTGRIISMVTLLALLLTLCAICISCNGDEQPNVPSDGTEESGAYTTAHTTDASVPGGAQTGENDAESGSATGDQGGSGNVPQPEDTQKYGEFHFGFQ